MVVNKTAMVSVIKKVLGYLDIRLVSHGERVAYILLKMLEQENLYTKEEIRDLVFLGLVHDIGAYKTEEIDNIMEFEEKRPNDHAIYGYLFLKHFSPFSKYVETVLFHHVDNNSIKDFESDYLDLGLRFHFADRIDLVYKFMNETNPDAFLNRYKNRFSDLDILLFSKINNEKQVIKKLKDGSFESELNEFFDNNPFSYDYLIKFLEMLAYIIDFKSEFTVTHNIMVVTIAQQLALSFNLNKEEIEKIKLAAWLHDIGKIATPIDILEKPGKLTKEEMDIMKKHILYSEEIVRGLVNDEVVNIAIRHHEKLDGSGYPYGLTSKDLTFSDRILAVSDIISALANKRSYKEAFDKERIITILNEMVEANKICGTIVERFINNFDIIMNDATLEAKHTIEEYLNIKEEFRYYSDLLEAKRKVNQ